MLTILVRGVYERLSLQFDKATFRLVTRPYPRDKPKNYIGIELKQTRMKFCEIFLLRRHSCGLHAIRQST